MIMARFVSLPVLAVVLVSGARSQSSPASRPAAPESKEPALRVPFASAPTVDGKQGDAEWNAALVADGPSGRILLQHDGDRLYVAAITDVPQIVTLFFGSENETRVLHSSARLGEARYALKGGAWSLTRPFEYRPPSAEFQASEKWIASTMGSGAKSIAEFAVDLSAFGLSAPDASKRARLAVSTLAMAASGGLRVPRGLADDTGNSQLLMGFTPSPLRFSPAKWASLELSPKPASKPSRG